jgi:signal transduction histidine kinase
MLTALVHLQDWFLPDELRRDPNRRRRALCFVWSTLCGPLTGIAILIFLYLRDPRPVAWYAAMGAAVLSFSALPIALKMGGRFELLSFVSAQLFGVIVLFLVVLFGGVQSPFMPWFIAVVMTGGFYFGDRRRLRNPFLACVAIEFAASYALSALDLPVLIPLPRDAIDALGTVSDFCLVMFLSGLTLNFVAIVNMQQRELQAEVRTRDQAEKRLTATLDEANQAVRSKATFLANTSHELRTPLNAIIGFADLIRSETFGPLHNARYRDYLDDIAASGQHLLNIINDILDFSKFEAGKATLENEEPIDLGILIGAASRMIQPQADGAKVVLAAEIDPRLPPVLGNERLLNQVILNLLSNAVKFTPPAGSVTVRAGQTDDGGVAIRVADTGIGMSDDDIKVALTAFGQVDSNLARRFPGTGLGLPLVKAIVELHRGTFQLRSAPGRGTEATVLLPGERVFAPAQAMVA